MNRTAILHYAAAMLILAAAKIACAQATAFSGSFAVAPNWTHSKSNGSAVVYEQIGAILYQAHTFGTNANQMSAFWRSVVTLTNGEVRTFNLKAATNSFGDALAFRRINFISVKLATNASAAFAVGGSALNPAVLWHDDATYASAIQPGGVLAFTAPDVAGVPVATNSCYFDVENTGTNSAAVEIYVGGVAQ